MDAQKFAEDYSRIISLSDCGADIYGSAYCREYIAHAGAAQPFSTLLRMQLDQERFFRSKSLRRCSENPEELAAAVQADVCADIHDRLACYSEAERRGALLSMLDQVNRMNGRGWTGQDRAAWAGAPEDALEKRLAADIMAGARNVLARVRVEDSTAGAVETERSGPGPSRSAAAAASAVTAYGQCPELRDMPECIADTSAAASAMGERFSRGDMADIAQMVGGLLLLTAAYLLVSMIAATAFGTAAAFVSEWLETGIAWTWKEAEGMFISAIKLLSTELKVLAGAGAAGLALEGIAYLAHAYPDSSPAAEENAEPADIQADAVQPDGEDECEEEEDQEYLSQRMRT